MPVACQDLLLFSILGKKFEAIKILKLISFCRKGRKIFFAPDTGFSLEPMLTSASTQRHKYFEQT